jgi:hypothetical protein
VRRADLDQFDATTADLDVEVTFEGAVGQTHLDAVELEFTEEAAEQIADVAGAC